VDGLDGCSVQPSRERSWAAADGFMARVAMPARACRPTQPVMPSRAFSRPALVSWQEGARALSVWATGGEEGAGTASPRCGTC
jgi:hypothetical protein